jgi:hypothetical protein
MIARFPFAHSIGTQRRPEESINLLRSYAVFIARVERFTGNGARLLREKRLGPYGTQAYRLQNNSEIAANVVRHGRQRDRSAPRSSESRRIAHLSRESNLFEHPGLAQVANTG